MRGDVLKMEITKTRNDSELDVVLSGRLDTATSSDFDAALKDLDGVEMLVIDFGDVAYISSSGLRVLLSAQKRMNKQGKMVVSNVNNAVMEVFQMTGFTSILTIE